MVRVIPEDRVVIDEIENEGEFKDGYGYERFEMTADQLTALMQKKMIFINVQEEYAVGIVLVVRKQEDDE